MKHRNIFLIIISINYKCSANNSYYDSKTTAISNCTNYCPSGSLHNSKCYKLVNEKVFKKNMKTFILA